MQRYPRPPAVTLLLFSCKNLVKKANWEATRCSQERSGSVRCAAWLQCCDRAFPAFHPPFPTSTSHRQEERAPSRGFNMRCSSQWCHVVLLALNELASVTAQDVSTAQVIPALNSTEPHGATTLQGHGIPKREPLLQDPMSLESATSDSYHYCIHLNFPANSPGEGPLMKKSSASGLCKRLIFTSLSWQHRHIRHKTLYFPKMEKTCCDRYQRWKRTFRRYIFLVIIRCVIFLRKIIEEFCTKNKKDSSAMKTK